MELNAPKVSVMISAYNEEKYVVESIQSILAQSFTEIEVLVVDDGSSDATFNRILGIKDDRIVAIRQQNRGKAATLNSLIAMAKGKYLMVQDADDISAENRIQVQYDYLESNPHLAMVLCGHSLIINDKVVAPRGVNRDSNECLKLVKNLRLPAHDPTLLVRKDIAQSFLFDESLRMGQGVDFIFRIAEVHPIEVISDVLYYYRFHTSSITKADPLIKAKKLFEVLNKARSRHGEPLWNIEEFIRANRKWASDKDNNLSGHFSESTYLSVIHGRRVEAIRTALTSIRFWRGNNSYLKPAIYAVLPQKVCRWGRKIFGQ